MRNFSVWFLPRCGRVCIVPVCVYERGLSPHTHAEALVSFVSLCSSSARSCSEKERSRFIILSTHSPLSGESSSYTHNIIYLQELNSDHRGDLSGYCVEPMNTGKRGGVRRMSGDKVPEHHPLIPPRLTSLYCNTHTPQTGSSPPSRQVWGLSAAHGVEAEGGAQLL